MVVFPPLLVEWAEGDRAAGVVSRSPVAEEKNIHANTYDNLRVARSDLTTANVVSTQEVA